MLVKLEEFNRVIFCTRHKNNTIKKREHALGVFPFTVVEIAELEFSWILSSST